MIETLRSASAEAEPRRLTDQHSFRRILSYCPRTCHLRPWMLRSLRLFSNQELERHCLQQLSAVLHTCVTTPRFDAGERRLRPGLMTTERFQHQWNLSGVDEPLRNESSEQYGIPTPGTFSGAAIWAGHSFGCYPCGRRNFRRT